MWYVVHVHDAVKQEAAFRVGILPNDGQSVQKDPDDIPDGPVRMCLANGMTPPFDVAMFGPMDEPMSHLVYGLFDGKKMSNVEHQKMIEKLNRMDPDGRWLNMRTDSN